MHPPVIWSWFSLSINNHKQNYVAETRKQEKRRLLDLFLLLLEFNFHLQNRQSMILPNKTRSSEQNDGIDE